MVTRVKSLARAARARRDLDVAATDHDVGVRAAVGFLSHLVAQLAMLRPRLARVLVVTGPAEGEMPSAVTRPATPRTNTLLPPPIRATTQCSTRNTT